MATERSGSFRITDLDADALCRLFNPQLYNVTIRPDRRVPCPSFWRHPIQWLRWNPLLQEPEKVISLNGVQMIERRGVAMLVFPAERS